MERVVRIDETKNKINHMIVWSYAYQQARKSEWECLARDRFRFKRRINEVGESLKSVLENNHRLRIYEERFVNM